MPPRATVKTIAFVNMRQHTQAVNTQTETHDLSMLDYTIIFYAPPSVTVIKSKR